ncbi:MAG: CRTAC1 family protein [Phycisphaerales bacterium]|nr:CRTAC1 family protein [Phycisphaerales bacterium]
MDILAVGPASPGWAPRAEYVSGRFWLNKGGFQFAEATDTSGLSSLNWVYRDWCEFFETSPPRPRPNALIDPAERRPYFADAIFGDFDNDGWVDCVVLDRSESQNPPSRAVLFMNQGNGTFEPEPTKFSGIDGSGISGEAADLNNDGLLDLVIAADPDNSGGTMEMDRYQSKVYWNTGLPQARENHWLRLRFSGLSDAELIGARVEVFATGMRQARWIHSNHSYKSSGALETHFGLGKNPTVDLTVTLSNGKATRFPGLSADQFLDLDIRNVKAAPVASQPRP